MKEAETRQLYGRILPVLEKQLAQSKDCLLIQGLSQPTVVDALYFYELRRVFAVDGEVQKGVLSSPKFKSIPEWYKKMQKEFGK